MAELLIPIPSFLQKHKHGSGRDPCHTRTHHHHAELSSVWNRLWLSSQLWATWVFSLDVIQTVFLPLGSSWEAQSLNSHPAVTQGCHNGEPNSLRSFSILRHLTSLEKHILELRTVKCETDLIFNKLALRFMHKSQLFQHCYRSLGFTKSTHTGWLFMLLEILLSKPMLHEIDLSSHICPTLIRAHLKLR